MAEHSIHIEFTDPRWQQVDDLLSKIETIVAHALEAQESQAALTIRLSSADEVRVLNRDFRKRDKPTNVLSFPDGSVEAGETYLGDIIIAYEIVEREAVEQDKSLLDHTLHMALHGVLHLLGYDHEVETEAEAMEQYEAEILAQFGIARPYE